jgi:hypothetical protein
MYIVKKIYVVITILVIMFKNVARPTGYNKRRRRRNQLGSGFDVSNIAEISWVLDLIFLTLHKTIVFWI